MRPRTNRSSTKARSGADAPISSLAGPGTRETAPSAAPCQRRHPALLVHLLRLGPVLPQGDLLALVQYPLLRSRTRTHQDDDTRPHDRARTIVSSKATARPEMAIGKRS